MSARLIKQRVIMPIMTSKRKIYCKIQVLINIQTDSVINDTLNATNTNNPPCGCQLKISYIIILGHCFTFYDMPWSGRSFTNALVGTQFYDMPWSRRIFRHAWSGRSFTRCHGRDAVLRYSVYPGREAVLRHAQVRTQFNDIPI